MANSWEDRFAELNVVQLEEPIQPDEEPTARKVWEFMRYMVTNRSQPDEFDWRGTPDPATGAVNDYPEDPRPVDPSHTVAWLAIEHHGTYWAVSYGSREFSSSFSTMARGATLADALAQLDKQG